MIIRFKKKYKINKTNHLVEPDEIFLDSNNQENFNRQQFEGRIEKAISKKTIFSLGAFFTIIIVIFFVRLGYLQIQKGEAYTNRSNNNTLEKQIIFSDRGIIFDRNNVPLAWNNKDTNNDYAFRSYISPGFSHLLGYVSNPAKDEKGKYWQTQFIGKDGLEKQYNDQLNGQNGEKIIERDVRGQIHTENIVNNPIQGKDLITTIDARLQKELFSVIKNTSDMYSFKGGAGVLMDITNGEIIAQTSFPEFSSEVISQGKDKNTIENYLKDNRKVFLDRTISGLYTPGSIVKPFFALAALSEGVISPEKKILSSGTLIIPNPYFPDLPSIFKDWKAHGWVDMRGALAVSSDIYFYEVGGGFEDQKGIGILKIKEYAEAFGIGELTGVDLPDEKKGVIPSPEWKALNFKGEPWRVGDTYNTVIGQYGFQLTPLEITRAISAIATKGFLPSPHLLMEVKNDFERIDKDIDENYYKIIHEGMRDGVLYGTSAVLNVPYIEIASKTGTAQVGLSKSKVNSWITGFFPYQNPKYAFTIMMEEGPSGGTVGAVSVAKNFFDWISLNAKEYIQ